MTASKELNSMFVWIITISWWICCCESSAFKNLRRNKDEVRCMSELMRVDRLYDDQFSASSYFQNKTIFHPRMARLLDIHSQSSPTDGKAWCPATPVNKHLTEWIEVDFRHMTYLRALYTMGRGDGNFKKFSPEILIRYQRTKSGPWYTYHDSQNETIIPINTDSRTKLRTSLQTIVVTRIRIYPLDTRSGPKLVCLKIAFLGCDFDDEVASYTAPQGDRGFLANRIINLRDESYDGKKSEILQHGLGLLLDNVVRDHSYDSDYYISRDMTSYFTGWKCSQERRKTPISITFYFEQERVFSKISIHYFKNLLNNIILTAPIVTSIGYDNDTHRSLYNHTTLDIKDDLASEYRVDIPLYNQKGTICTINLTCGIDNWIILEEVQIKSTKSSDEAQYGNKVTLVKPNRRGSTDKALIKPPPDYNASNSMWRQKDFSLFMIVGLVFILVMIILSCVAFLLYRIKKMRKHKLNKKLELAAKCTNRSLGDPSSRTVFTTTSKHPSMSSICRPAYYSDNKCSAVNTLAGSQAGEGIYASWPNTDEDADAPNVDKEEEKCLLETDINDNRSMGKDYAIYQPGVNLTANEFFHNLPQSSTIISIQNINLNDKVPLSVAHLKIVSSYDLPKSTPIVTYRSSKNVISYQHFINYGGICGDVDIRYQSSPARSDCQGLDSIKMISTSSLLFVKPWVRGQYGSVDIATVATNSNDTCHYFMKTLIPDSPPAIKSKFIVDLKILSTLNISSIARLAAIVVDGDLLHNDVADVIRSARFCLLVEHSGGYNLKEFLRSTYYPNSTQNYKTTTAQSQSQVSTSSMLLIVTQISSGLRHLEELGLAHRDVGCRNCTIDSRRQVKIYPGGYVTTQPFEDYCTIELQNHLIHFPLRWLAPESISLGVFTSKSDVWSFGVTMWEVFTLCRVVPYPSLTNDALLELMVDRDNSPRLMCSQSCPREIYDLMIQCWSWEESLRPRFVDINMYLQIMANGSTNSAQFTLPGPPPSVTNNYQSI